MEDLCQTCNNCLDGVYCKHRSWWHKHVIDTSYFHKVTDCILYNLDFNENGYLELIINNKNSS